jgi:ATP-binding cassette, subfamily B, bacterial
LNFAAWRSFARLLQGTRRLIVLSLVIAIGQSLLLIPIAFLVRRAFDVTIPGGDTSGLILMGAAILGLFMASLALGVLTRRLALRATRDSVVRLRQQLTEKILLAPRAYFDRADLGTLHATIVQDTERLEVMTIALVSVLMPGAVIAFALVATLFVIAPVLAALLLVVVPAVLLVGRMLNRRVRQGTRRWQRAYDAFSSQTQLALRSATLIRLHGAEGSELDRRREQIDELGEKRLAMLWAQNLYSQITAIITAAAGVVVLVVGGVLVSNDSLSLGDLISFYAVLGLLRTQLLSGGLAVPGVIAGQESLGRLESILEEDAAAPYEGSAPIDFAGSVALRGVSFEYVPGRPVLRDVDFEIPSGESVALLGPNGAGKSTIISLIAGLYAPQSGEILIDGRPLAELDLGQLRRRIGVIEQDSLIFPTSVAENIGFGSPDAGPEEIEAAARRAGAHELIVSLPGGYDARVGDEGVLLSGGQRQKIALARALLGDPALLMLDEPTTHLDSAGSRALMESLHSDPDRPSLLIVTHDPLVATAADRVEHLRDGRLQRVTVNDHGTEPALSIPAPRDRDEA